MGLRIVAQYLTPLLALLVGMALHLDLDRAVPGNSDRDDDRISYFRPSVSDNQGSANALLPGVTSARLEPFAIRIGQETARLILGVDDPAVVEVRMQAFLLSLNGELTDFITLVDDGTQGDEVAGDGLFTRDQLTIARPYELSSASRNFSSANMTFTFEDGHQEEGPVQLGYLTLIGVDPGVETPNVDRGNLADNVHQSDFVVNIVRDFDGVFPNLSIDPQEVAREYYSVFPDDKDFMIISILFNWAGLGGFHHHITSDVEGIGLDTWDVSSEYGSAGYLGSLIVSTYPGPQLLNHEILHRWVGYLDTLAITRSGHWVAVERSGSGFTLTSNRVNGGIYRGLVKEGGDKEYRAWHTTYSGVYNDLELYLMGLIPASDVAGPIRTLINPTYQSTVVPPPPSAGFDPGVFVSQFYDIYHADGIREIQFEDIITAVGERNPDHQNSQKAFKSVLVVPYDRPLTDTEFAALDYQMREYEKPDSDFGPLTHSLDHTFEAATGGRATLETRLKGSPTGVAAERVGNELPHGYALYQNYPNPFNPSTRIRYDLPVAADVRLAVFDALGRELVTLVNTRMPAGQHEITWGPRDLASGFYIYKIEAGKFTTARRMLLAR